MSNNLEVCMELLNMVSEQDALIANQNSVITKLVTDNMEKENMINVLMEDLDGFY